MKNRFSLKGWSYKKFIIIKFKPFINLLKKLFKRQKAKGL